MDLEDKEEQQAADMFLRNCIKHISNATNVQKAILLKTLVERPPEITNKLDLAISAWNGLEEKEILQLLGVLQKQFDRETWEFISRWRINK